MRQYETQSGPQGYIALIIVCGIIGYLALDSLANLIGVDVNATLTLVIGLVCTIVLFACGLWSQVTDSWPLTVANVTPMALVTFVLAFSPTLHQLGSIGPVWADLGVKWWGSLYTHYGLAFAILLIGYGNLYLRRD